MPVLITTLTNTGPFWEYFVVLPSSLTGAGDVGRYLTPGVTLVALTPAPYTSVRLDDLRGDR